MINLPSLESVNVNEKRVFVRCDFDVPLSEQSTIADDTRLVSAISTIEYLLENGAMVIAGGHLGRPSLPSSTLNAQHSKLSLEPVAEWFAEEFPGASLYRMQLNGFPAWQIKRNFYILENLRLFDGEESNNKEFAEKLANLSDIYVNEAFSASHRSHASIVGVPKILPHYAGFHLSKEVKVLASILKSPNRPFTIVVGGEKIETKLPLISKMHSFSDYVLVGGKIADETKALIKEQHKNISKRRAILIVADHNLDKTDISNISLENFLQIISRSRTIVWNGPLGVITPPTQNSKLKTQKLAEGDEGYASLKLAEAIIDSKAYRVAGGGDTVGFLSKYNLLSKFDFVSMGGGAMLQFLSGQPLPGLVALQN